MTRTKINIGTKIMKERKKNRWSRSGLAREIGISYAHLWRIERNQSQSGILVLARIAKVLGKPVDYFIQSIRIKDTNKRHAPAPAAKAYVKLYPGGAMTIPDDDSVLESS